MNNPNLTKVYLLNTPLENDYKHTIWFTSEEDQEAYFLSLAKSEFKFEDLMYQRKDYVIKVPKAYDDLLGCNYVMYQNGNGKWYYAFITDLRFNSNGMTEVEIETDVIQTWMFDNDGNRGFIVKPSFVEREHVDDDTIGANTYPEQVELGEYVCNYSYEDGKGASMVICMALTDYANVKLDVEGQLHGGIYSGLQYRVYDTNEKGLEELNKRLDSFDSDTKGDAINSIFMAPRWLYTNNYPEQDWNTTTILEGTLPSTNEPIGYNIPIVKNYNMNGYSVRNKKLLTYPYNYLLVSNNAGGSAEYHYEQFNSEKCDFNVEGVICPGCSIRMIPLKYKGVNENSSYGLNGGKYAVCCWTSDVYTNWLTQNSVNIGFDLASGIAATGIGIAASATGIGAIAGASMIAGGIGQIGSTIGQVYAQSKVPDQAKGNTNCGDVITGSKKNCFMFYAMSIKKEYAAIIDEYFDMFGYKVCRVKIPNTSHRAKYWFTKTIDVNIDGAIPNKDLQKIKEAYNNGITFWRKGSDIGNYSTTTDYNKISKSYA